MWKNWHYLQRSVPSHFFCQIFQKIYFFKNVNLLCFSVRWIRIKHPFFDLRLLYQDMSTYHENVNFFKTVFSLLSLFFWVMNTNITPDLHILHRYQDKFGLYQEWENYNFRNFIKKFLQKKTNNRQKLIMNLTGNIFAAKFSHLIFNETKVGEKL